MALEKSNVAELNTDLSKQVSILREDVAALTKVMGDYTKAQAHDLRVKATDKASELAESGAAAALAAKATAQVAYSSAEDKIRQNPTSAVGIAAGLGFLVGFLTSRR